MLHDNFTLRSTKQIYSFVINPCNLEGKFTIELHWCDWESLQQGSHFQWARRESGGQVLIHYSTT